MNETSPPQHQKGLSSALLGPGHKPDLVESCGAIGSVAFAGGEDGCFTLRSCEKHRNTLGFIWFYGSSSRSKRD